jgi:capsule polysaccharide export protein KpsE/RkpR
LCSKKIKFDPKIYNITDEEWVRKPTKNRESKPSYLEAHKTYLDMISVTQDYNNNLILISVEHLSPIFAKELLELIINEANELIRSKDLQTSSEAIMFLNNETPKATLISMRDAINELVQSQLETQMLSKVSKEYVFKVIEPPFIPEMKSKPDRALICILGTLLGLMSSLVLALVRHYFFSNKTY